MVEEEEEEEESVIRKPIFQKDRTGTSYCVKPPTKSWSISDQFAISHIRARLGKLVVRVQPVR